MTVNSSIAALAMSRPTPVRVPFLCSMCRLPMRPLRAVEVGDRRLDLDRRDRHRLQVRGPPGGEAGQRAEREVREAGRAAGDRVGRAELGVHQRQRHQQDGGEDPGDQRRRPGGLRRAQRAEQPAGADDRAQRDEQQPEEPDAALQIPGRSGRRLVSTPAAIGAPDLSTVAAPRALRRARGTVLPVDLSRLRVTTRTEPQEILRFRLTTRTATSARRPCARRRTASPGPRRRRRARATARPASSRRRTGSSGSGATGSSSSLPSSASRRQVQLMAASHTRSSLLIRSIAHRASATRVRPPPCVPRRPERQTGPGA